MQSQEMIVLPPTCFRSSLTITPNNGLLYISSYGKIYIIYIPPAENDFPRVKIFSWNKTLIHVIADPIWEKGRKEFAVYDSNHKLMLFDVEQVTMKSHNAHTLIHPRNVSAENSAICYTYNRHILSVDNKLFVNYDVDANTYKTKAVSSWFNKQQVTILKASPYNFDIFAAGTKRGLILISSLKSMTALHQLRAHDSEIVSLDWTLIKQTMSSVKTQLDVVPKPAAMVPTTLARNLAAPQNGDDLFDIYSYDHLENEFGTYADNAIESEEDEIKEFNKVEMIEGNEHFDFVEACGNLKDVILQTGDTTTTDIDQLCEKVSNILDDPSTTPSEVVDSKIEIHNIEDLATGGHSLNLSCISNDSFKSSGNELPLKSSSHEDLPEAAEEEEDEVKEITLLASASKEAVIWIWNATEGVAMEKIKLSSMRSTICADIVSWIGDNTLLSNDGRLIEWKISVNNENKLNVINTGREFNRSNSTVFVANKSPSDSKFSGIWIQENNALTYLQISEEKITEKFSTAMLSLTVQSIEVNPLDSNIVAITSGKQIAVFNLSQITPSHVGAGQNLASKIASNVYALDWHPAKANVLAFSTKEGRIGIANTNQPDAVPLLLKPNFSSTVYSLSWGELTNTVTLTKQFVLFCCGQQKIVYYPESGNDKNPISVRIHGNCPKFVKVIGKYLAVGTNEGYLFICELNEKFTCLFGKSVGKKYITAFDWKNNNLAVSTTCGRISVLEITEQKLLAPDTIEVKSFTGHTDGIVSVRWNSDATQLVSASYDWTVRIWNAIDASCFKVFKFTSSMYACAFSPLNSNIVLVGGQGTTPIILDITAENSRTLGIFRAWGKGDAVVSASKELQESGSRENDRRRRGQAKGVKGETSGNASADDDSVSVLTENLKGVKINARTGPSNGHGEAVLAVNESEQPTVLYLCTKELNREPLQYLKHFISSTLSPDVAADPQTAGADGSVFYNEKFFSSTEILRDLLELELSNHKKSSALSAGFLLLPQMNGTLKEEILQRISTKTMNDEYLCLAPNISFEFWRNCCKAYGIQLIEKGLILKAIPYLWSCHDINEIIDQLCEAEYYREAYAVAKLRKEEDDPAFEQILCQWAGHLEKTGALEAAAVIFSINGKYAKAKNALEKRKKQTAEHEAVLKDLEKLMK